MYRDLAYCLLVAALFAACDAGTGDLIGPTPTTPTPTTSGIGSGPGCYRASYGGFGASAFQCGLLSSSGNAWFDGAFRAEARFQGDWFEDSASVSLFDDCTAPNAYSSDANYIVFGVRFADRMASTFDRELTLWQVMAHEFGHQLEFTYRYQDRVGFGQQFELMADAFSGFYVAYEHVDRLSQNIPGFVDGIWQSGDFNDPSHHGTPSQRARSFIVGMRVAIEELEGGVTLSWEELIDRFHDEITYDVIPQGAVPVGQAEARNLIDHLRELRPHDGRR